MINRENGLTEIFDRISANRVAIGIKSFRKIPMAPVQEVDMPCIVMSEGVDVIIQKASRSASGYPARRALQVILEVIAKNDTDIKTMFVLMRRAVFSEKGRDLSLPIKFVPILAEGVFINENSTEGPISFDLPGVYGMRLVLDLIYTDNGLI